MNTFRKRSIIFLSKTAFILGIITLLWLAYDYIIYFRLRSVMKEMGELGRLEFLSQFVWLSYLYMFCFHLLAAGTLVLQMRFVQKIHVPGLIAIAIGVFSFLGVFSEWAVFGDIGKEYQHGMDTSGEWAILFVILGIQLVFVLLVTGVSGAAVKYLRKAAGETSLPARDEVVFVLAQYVGIICGFCGLAWVAMAMVIGTITWYSIYHTISTILILMPYGLIVAYWIILKLRDGFTDWYDEKQWQDVTKAGFFTLLILIPSLLVFWIIFSLSGEQYPDSYLWYPFVLFLMLLLFSLFTLVNYRRN